MRVLLFTSLLTACGSPGGTEDFTAVDPQPVIHAMDAIELEPLIAWIEQPMALIDSQMDCPALTIVEQTSDSIHEHWTGGCQLADGRSITGEIERFESPDGAWIVGRDFRIYDGDDVLVGLDGAIEIIPTNDLWLVDVAAATCGAANWTCSQGLLGLDLNYTIYPAASFPSDYDATVSGTVATEFGTTTLDGAWSIDADVCSEEPASGLLSIHQGAHHAISHDGERACDGCADWKFQGQEAPRLCHSIR